MNKNAIAIGLTFGLVSAAVCAYGAEPVKTVVLPAPRTSGGMPIMQALKERKSGRAYSSKEIPLQTLSDMLWAGFGVSRPDGRRTAPSAANVQEIDIYIAKADGVFRYNAKENLLELISPDDIRVLTGKQPFVKDAPVNLIYVADMTGAVRQAAGLLGGYGCGVYRGERLSFLRFGRSFHRCQRVVRTRASCQGDETDG